jgi:sodium transport system permease protein
MTNSSLERTGVVFAKEVIDNFRDRRSLGSAVLGALLGPGIILIMLLVLGKAFFKEPEKPIDLPVQGAEHAPNLIAYLEQNNVRIKPAPADPQAAVRNGDVEVVLIIPADYGDAFTSGRPAALQAVYDSSRTSAQPTYGRLSALLDGYSRQVGLLRLQARGISPAVTEGLAVVKVDMATPQSQVLIFLNMLPYLLMFTIFSGGAGVIIDATAGERERNSLEPLLINPVARREFVAGKLLASLPFAFAAVLLSLSAFGIIFNVIPMEEIIGFQMSIDVGGLGVIFLICLPMVLLASAIQMIIATFARSFKEAQTYVGFLPLAPALPGIGLAFLPVKPALWTMLIPTFGQQILINQVMRGEMVSALNVGVSVAVTLVLAVVLTGVAVRLYQREQILFGKT